MGKKNEKKNKGELAPPPATITSEEEKILSRGLTREFRLLLRFLLETGCTVSEALATRDPEEIHRSGARSSDFPVSRSIFYQYEGPEKTKSIVHLRISGGRRKRSSGSPSPRTVYCSGTLLMEINKLRAAAAPYLFNDSVGNPLRREMITMRLARLSERLLGRRVTPAVLRHTCAARLFNAGADLPMVSEYLGHAAPSVTAALYIDPPDFPLPRNGPQKGYLDPWSARLCRFLRGKGSA